MTGIFGLSLDTAYSKRLNQLTTIACATCAGMLQKQQLTRKSIEICLRIFSAMKVLDSRLELLKNCMQNGLKQ